ncbi:MAG: prepilin-type N-terminal cleavage/methylation domain-containing protein [Candidatus Omnitrophica bacterium]|nr:prepilin-type N-terminal cleavage/methylation domain-containing protein [Candidatus Omnitrophota bacterium]
MKSGVTLVEILTVIVILALLAALALPHLGKERYIIGEAMVSLQLLYDAQKRYHLDHNAYAGDCSDLDADITPKYFNAPQCYAAGAASDDVASMLRPDTNELESYTVAVRADGTYHCWTTCGCGPCPEYVTRALPQ